MRYTAILAFTAMPVVVMAQHLAPHGGAVQFHPGDKQDDVTTPALKAVKPEEYPQVLVAPERPVNEHIEEVAAEPEVPKPEQKPEEKLEEKPEHKEAAPHVISHNHKPPQHGCPVCPGGHWPKPKKGCSNGHCEEHSCCRCEGEWRRPGCFHCHGFPLERCPRQYPDTLGQDSIFSKPKHLNIKTKVIETKTLETRFQTKTRTETETNVVETSVVPAPEQPSVAPDPAAEIPSGVFPPAPVNTTTAPVVPTAEAFQSKMNSAFAALAFVAVVFSMY